MYHFVCTQTLATNLPNSVLSLLLISYYSLKLCAETGAGIYVTSGQKSLPNNGLIVAGVTNRISEFRCLSGSSSPFVGQLLGPNGEDLTHIDSDHFLVHRGGSYDPGLVHVRRLAPLTREEQGVYTCRIPNERGIAVDVNVGLYLRDSAG